MGMKVVVKVKFNCNSERFDKFDFGKYIAYLPFEEGDDTASIVQGMISRAMGVPLSKVEFAGKDGRGNYVYEA